MKLTNPDGVVANVRGNSRNIDINRNFPTTNFGRGWFKNQKKEPAKAAITAIIIFLLIKMINYLQDNFNLFYSVLEELFYLDRS